MRSPSGVLRVSSLNARGGRGQAGTSRRLVAAPPNGAPGRRATVTSWPRATSPNRWKAPSSAGHHAHQLFGREPQTSWSRLAGPITDGSPPAAAPTQGRPNLLRIPWTRSALIQYCHETRTRFPYGEAPTADYGGAMKMCRDSRGSVRTRTETRTRLAFRQGAPAVYGGVMRDNLSRRSLICNERLYHDPVRTETATAPTEPYRATRIGCTTAAWSWGKTRDCRGSIY